MPFAAARSKTCVRAGCWLAMAAILITSILSGCTQTLHTGGTEFLPELKLPREPQESSLRAMSHEELTSKGTVYLQEGNTQLARLHFAMALKKAPQSIHAWLGMGEVFVAEKQLRKAADAYDQVLAIDPQSRVALLAAGRVRRLQAKNEEAAELLRTAHGYYPDDRRIMTELAITYDLLGHLKDAEPLHERVAAMSPQDGFSRNNLGFNYLLQGRYPAAIRELQAALQAMPGNHRIRNNLATAYALAGREDQAYLLLAGTIGEAGAYNNIGFFYMTMGRWEEAERALKMALQMHPVFYARAKENLENLKRIQNGR
jgi:tetratricopeptide (TPR) repeat protein